jgi:putative endonuclease
MDSLIVRCVVERPPHLFLPLLLPFTRCHNQTMVEQAYVYILSSSFQKLYIGVTSEIEIRILQHKESRFPNSFSSKYKIDKLVYFERFIDISTAITREKQLKRWSRIKKIRLIVAQNPTWKDLSEEWGKPVAPFTETKS